MSYARQMLDTCPLTFNVEAGLLASTSTRSAIALRHALPTPAAT